MPHPLQVRFAELRRRLRLTLLVYGVSWFLAVVVGAALVAGFADWLFHFDDPGVRLILAGVIFTLGAIVGYRRLLVPLWARIGDRDLALRLEARFPEFKDALASTVQFLEEQHDPRLGSPALQRRAIEQTLSRADLVDFDDVLQVRPVKRIAVIAAVVCSVSALLVGLNRVEASTALKRLVFPFAAHPWPKKTELRLVDANLKVIEPDPNRPLRVARGETLETLFINANPPGRLPAKMRLEYQVGGDGVSEELLTHVTRRDEAGATREVGAGSLPVKSPLKFRAVGGDDQGMPWFRVEVVPPPVVDTLSVTLVPPAYSRRPPVQLSNGVGHVEGLVGTKVNISAAVNKPLRSAVLRLKDQEQPVDLDPGHKQLSASFTIDEPGVYSYWLDLTDREGFANRDAPRYEVRGIQDAVPEIYLDEPATDLQTTANAEVPIRAVAKDDLGLKSMWLRFRLNDASSAQSAQEAATTIPLFDGDQRPLQQTAEYVWKLADLALPPGTQLVFHAEATDDFDLGPEHLGRSLPRTLTIVSAEEKSRELAERQGSILGDIERALKQESTAQARIDELQLQARKAGKLRTQDLDLLQQIELQQRQFADQLQSPTDGIERKARKLLAELDQNQIDDPESRPQLQEIADEMQRLAREHLPVIEQELTRARQEAEGATAEPLAQSLRRAAENQAAVSGSLQQLLRQLSKWRDERTIGRELDEIIAGQKELNDKTAELGKRTVTKSLQELSAQDQADVARLASAQQSHTERFQQLQIRLDELAERKDESESSDDSTLKDAADHARQEAIAAQLRDASASIRENDVGAAAERQQRALDELQKLGDIVHHRGESDTDALVKQLRQAEDELESLEKREKEFLRKVHEASAIEDPREREQELLRLKKEQQQLRQDAAQLARKLRRMQAAGPSETAEAAAESMEAVEDELEQLRRDEAEADVQAALDDIEQARRELAQERQRTEERLFHEKLGKIADDLKGMIAREQSVIDETIRLEGIHAAKGNWSRAQLRSLNELAGVQRALKTETDHLVETLSVAEAFALALKGAARQMDAAAGLLGDRQTGEETQRLERAAQRRFVDLMAALKEDPASPQKNGSEPQGGDGQRQGNPPPGEAIPAVAQLKLLRALQLELNERTFELARRREGGRMTPVDKREQEALHIEQGELADLARNLSPNLAQPAPADELNEAIKKKSE